MLIVHTPSWFTLPQLKFLKQRIQHLKILWKKLCSVYIIFARTLPPTLPSFPSVYYCYSALRLLSDTHLYCTAAGKSSECSLSMGRRWSDTHAVRKRQNLSNPVWRTEWLNRVSGQCWAGFGVCYQSCCWMRCCCWNHISAIEVK